MRLIDHYYHFGEGYDPYLITPHWQVAQLNYTVGLSVANLEAIECHRLTDEAFILMKGRAVLVAADNVPKAIWFETVDMKIGHTYNVPRGRWHTIVMKPDSEVMIVENANTHKKDVEYYKLPMDMLSALKRRLEKMI